MAIKTYINGSANGTITFKGDTEPCAVYVNGERQDNISYIPQDVEGEKSVMYKSEYKKNIRSLSIEGNTSSPIIEQAVSSDDFTSTGSNFIAYYITTEQFTVLQEWATDKGYTGNFNLFVSVKNTGEIPTGFSVVAGNSLDDILVGGGNTTTIYYKSSYDGEIKDTVAVNLSDTVYVGIGNTNEGVGDNASEYLNLFLSNFTLCLQPTEYEGMPSPENPSAIKNSNDSGMAIILQGKNLIKYPYYDAAGTSNGVTFIYNDDGSIAIKGTATADAYRRISRNLQLDGGRYTLSGGTVGVIVNCFKDNKWFGQSASTRDFSFTITDGGEILNTVSVYVNSGTTVDTTIYPQIEKGNIATAYEPYFNKTVSIPSSVTLSDGASLAMNLAKVGNKADKLNLKGARVIYSQNTERITLTGEESGWSETDGKYKYSPGKTLIANSGYCTHFILSGTGENNTFGVESDGITFKTDVATGLESFKVWLKAQSDAGNAVTVMVALASPVEYDLTDIDVGQNLLALSAYTKNLTNIIKVTPNDTASPDVSSISVSYAKWGANLNN